MHVVQRGNNRIACFRAESDYLLYLHCLRQLSEKRACAIHAYCLMPNHVHLLITPAATGSCAALMRDLGQRYVQYFNRSYGRTGTLWEGRFRSCVAESARYVLACYRYIELNPVRAGIVHHPREYAWSSYRANAEEHDDPLITAHPEYASMGNDRASQRAAYRGLVEGTLEASIDDSIRSSTNGGYPLVSEPFKSSVMPQFGRKLERGRPGRPRNQDANVDEWSQEIGL